MSAPGIGTGPNLANDFPEAAAVGRLLGARGWTIGVAESCTGGLLGAALTSVPGSSAYVVGGVIAYSNRLKTDLLGVDVALIARHGAVSAEVAEAMARGCVSRLGVDMGLAITGVAGPGGDDDLKPAGLIHVAVAVAIGDVIMAERLEGDRGRAANRTHAVTVALRLGTDALTASIRTGSG